jgi:ribonuclease-3
VSALAELIQELPEELKGNALTHSSWTEERVESYERLAYLGDSVLGLAVAIDLYERFPEIDAGGLTKIHNQAVSGVSCAEVGRDLGVPEMLAAAEPADEEAIPADVLLCCSAARGRCRRSPRR